MIQSKIQLNSEVIVLATMGPKQTEEFLARVSTDKTPLSSNEAADLRRLKRVSGSLGNRAKDAEKDRSKK